MIPFDLPFKWICVLLYNTGQLRRSMRELGKFSEMIGCLKNQHSDWRRV